MSQPEVLISPVMYGYNLNGMAKLFFYNGVAWMNAVEKSAQIYSGSGWSRALQVGDHVRGSDGAWHELTSDTPTPQLFFGTGGPNDNIYDSTTGRRMYVLQPAGYNASVPNALGIFLHGAGQVGTNVVDVLEDGLPQVISETGQLMKCLWGFPQLTTGGWQEYLDAIVKAIDYMSTYYNVDSNRIYLSGLSNGAEGVIAYLIAHNIQIAGYAVSSPPSTAAAANAALLKDIPGSFTVGLSDSTVGVGNTTGPLNAILAQNGRISPLSKFIYGTGHGRDTWNAHLYNLSTAGWDFEDWLRLHNLDRKIEAGNYVARAESDQDYFHYKEAERIVNALSASAEKTALLSRLSTLEIYHTTGKQRILVSLGTSAFPATGNYNQITSSATGTTITNLIDMDGVATGISFKFDYTQWDADLPGQAGVYHGFDKGVMAESRRYFQSNTNSFNGISGTVTCRVDILPYYKTESGTSHYGVTGIIGGVTKNSVDDVYNVMDYLTWEGLTPASGKIAMNLNAQYPSGSGDGSNDGGICAIMLTIYS